MQKSEVKIGAVLSYVIIGLNAIVGIFYTPFLTRMLGQSEYGLYALVASIISYITVLDFGFGNAIVVYTSKFLAKKDKIGEQKLHGMFLLIYIVIGIIAGAVGFILYLNVETLFGNTMTAEEIATGKVLMAILTFNLVITFPFSIFTNIITAYEKFIFSKCLNIIRVIALPLCMTPLLLFGYKSIALVIVTTIINVGVLAANTFYCMAKIKTKFIFKNFDYSLLKEIFFYSFFIFLNIVVDKANWEVDKVILGAVCSTYAVAVYSVAVQFGTIYMSFSTAIKGVLLPHISKMEEKKATDKQFSNIFIETGRLQFVIMGLALSGFLIFGRQFIDLLFGQEYSDSYIIAAILMVPITIPLIQNVGLNILQAKNKYWFRSLVYIAIAIANIVLSIILAPKYEGIGTAFGTGISFFIGNFIIMNIYYKLKIHINIGKFWKEIIKIALPIFFLSVPFALIVHCLNTSNIIIFITEICIYTLFYSALMYYVCMNDKEKNLVKFWERKRSSKN